MDAIEDRVTIFLERYLEWLRTGLRWMEEHTVDFEQGDLHELVTFQARRDEEVAQLLSEQTVLSREWRVATGVAQEKQERIAQLQGDIEKLQVTLQEHYAKAEVHMKRAQDAIGEDLQQLRVSKESLQGICPTGDGIRFF